MRQGVAWISTQGPSTGRDANMYYSYYATQLVRHYGGKVWEQWNRTMRDFLVDSQAQEGPAHGSWAFSGLFGGPNHGGRLYHTSLAAMVLQVDSSHRLP